MKHILCWDDMASFISIGPTKYPQTAGNQNAGQSARQQPTGTHKMRAYNRSVTLSSNNYGLLSVMAHMVWMGHLLELVIVLILWFTVSVYDPCSIVSPLLWGSCVLGEEGASQEKLHSFIQALRDGSQAESSKARDGKQASSSQEPRHARVVKQESASKRVDKGKETTGWQAIEKTIFLYKQERRACKSRSRQESARLAVVKAKRPASKESCPKQESASKKSRQGKKKTGGKQRKTNDSEGTGRNSRTKYSEGMHELEKTRRKTRAKEAISHLRSSAFVDYGVRILGPQNNTLPGYHDPLKSASWT
ncbi:hypothetical protein Tco_0508573 [Tanacetum coccineum]